MVMVLNFWLLPLVLYQLIEAVAVEARVIGQWANVVVYDEGNGNSEADGVLQLLPSHYRLKRGRYRFQWHLVFRWSLAIQSSHGTSSVDKDSVKCKMGWEWCKMSVVICDYNDLH
ncbi:hypothetical protein NE237_025747 [Protea cynaroides]|uniref:Secreted protein n=1 Tax=Protea cynaroides TaxID=273540 RepID=A0A9Q0K0H3_9MAGN|nr:hypothetical protein NE237_025747 [Protea cynaroides]